MDAGIGISVRFRVENTLSETFVHPATPIRLRFSRSSELMCSVLSHCKVASNRVTALLQPNKHVGRSVLDRKSPKDSNFAIYISFRGPQHVRFLSVRSKLQQQIRWKKALVPRIAQNRLFMGKEIKRCPGK